MKYKTYDKSKDISPENQVKHPGGIFSREKDPPKKKIF